MIAHMTRRSRQRSHARRRAQERLGIRFTRRMEHEVVAQIQGGTAAFVRKTSNRVSVWNVALSGRRVDVVYDRQRKTIVTILPIEAAA